MLYALLAGTGMRIGEASGLEIDKHISHDASTVIVQQSVWSGALSRPGFCTQDPGVLHPSCTQAADHLSIRRNPVRQRPV